MLRIVTVTISGKKVQHKTHRPTETRQEEHNQLS